MPKEPIYWNVDMEVSLFHALRGHKPVGVMRHFQMLCIQDKLNTALSQKLTCESIWDHMRKMYDLQALNESEILPFPNKVDEFCLPNADFRELLVKDYPRFLKDMHTSHTTNDLMPQHQKEVSATTEITNTDNLTNMRKSNTKLSSQPTTMTPSTLTMAIKIGDESQKHRKRTRQTQNSSASEAPPPTKRRR